jgi:hypothetical protein
MKFSQEIFTRQISWLAALKLEIKQRLSYTLSFMGQEMPRSEVSLEELQRMVNDLRKSSLAIRLLLEDYENELQWHLEEVMFLDWMGEGSMYGHNTRH